MNQFWVEKYYEIPQWPVAPLVLRTETLIIGTQDYSEAIITTQEYRYTQ